MLSLVLILLVGSSNINNNQTKTQINQESLYLHLKNSLNREEESHVRMYKYPYSGSTVASFSGEDQTRIIWFTQNLGLHMLMEKRLLHITLYFKDPYSQVVGITIYFLEQLAGPSKLIYKPYTYL